MRLSSRREVPVIAIMLSHFDPWDSATLSAGLGRAFGMLHFASGSSSAA